MVKLGLFLSRCMRVSSQFYTPLRIASHRWTWQAITTGCHRPYFAIFILNASVRTRAECNAERSCKHWP